MEARNFNLPRSQEFDSETIGDIELINDATSDQDSVEATTKALEQKIKLNEGGKVFPVGANVARKVHRNDNPHLARLHPPQMEELVAQKEVHFLQVLLFEIECAIFYTNLHGIVLSVHKLNILGKFMDNYLT